jgi:undecaprenyl-diphosphatase
VLGWFQAAFLGILQGLTEFLPISSSAHLRIVPDLFGWRDPGASFTAVIQIGTELAVLLYFRHDIIRIIRTWVLSLVRPALRSDFDAKIGWYVIIGTIPIGVFGVLFQDQIKSAARNLWLIAITLVALGVVLGAAERASGRRSLRHKHKPIEALTVRHAVLYGLAQACALVPGVSRSGGTISMGLFLGYRREAATRYAFLLAIPAVLAAGLFQLPDVAAGDSPYTIPQTIVATVLAFAVGYATIAWLLSYVSTRSYLPFVVYRIALGILVVALLAAGALTAKSDITSVGAAAVPPAWSPPADHPAASTATTTFVVMANERSTRQPRAQSRAPGRRRHR